MQSKAVIFSLLAGVALAADQASVAAQFPSCALPCLITAATDVGCGLTDAACLCQNLSKASDSAGTCLSDACSPDDMAKTAQVSGEMCESAMGGDSAAPAGSSMASAGSKPLASAPSTAQSHAPRPTGSLSSVTSSAADGLMTDSASHKNGTYSMSAASGAAPTNARKAELENAAGTAEAAGAGLVVGAAFVAAMLVM